MSKRHPDFDYEAEGLLDDVEGSDAKAARARLLDYLIDDELVEPEEVLLAHAEQRLFLLPVERALGGTPRFTAAQVAEKSGIDVELFLELRRSLGLAEPEHDQVFFSEFDVKTMKSVRANLDMGMSLESIREINRVLGGALSQLAVVVERQFLATYLEPALDEAEMAKRYAAITRATTPEFAFVLQHLFNLHLRDELRADILGNEAAIDFLDGTREMTVCFADLVGFTSLGQQIPAEELGEIAERFNSIAAGVVRPPVRLVKTIGDAVMLASTSPGELLDTALDLMEAVIAEGEDFPELSVGIAFGTAVERGGDVYGPPVNLASRLCDVARPGAILATEALREAFRDEYDWSSAGRRRFKGIDEPVAGYRMRRKGGRASAKSRRSS
ncbi:MAG: adenylate cyclase regulatory domain-containing protein [Solirubrobacterales bacterium]